MMENQLEIPLHLHYQWLPIVSKFMFMRDISPLFNVTKKTLKKFFQSFFRSVLECILKNLLLLDRHGDGDGLMDIECHWYNSLQLPICDWPLIKSITN